jgi:putative iron-dependent peroxidase
VGLGPELINCWALVPGLRSFAAFDRAGCAVCPAHRRPLCCWLRGTETGDLLQLTRQLAQCLAPACGKIRWWMLSLRTWPQRSWARPHRVMKTVPKTRRTRPRCRPRCCRVVGQGWTAAVLWWCSSGCMTWMLLPRWPRRSRTSPLGVRASATTSLPDAPESAHVKRTAQEDFTPPAFVLRRSMPWTCGAQSGLMFVAFGHSFDAFEAQMRRMAGLDDGVVDGLFSISRPSPGPTSGARRCSRGGWTCVIWACDRRGRSGWQGAVAAQTGLYLDLIRWDRPAGWLLLLWPTLSALWVAAGGISGLAFAGGVYAGHHPDAQRGLLHQRRGRPRL